MADKPNNNEIEQQLQEYAKRRHEAAGRPVMHPAMRQMLQVEVKQRFGATKAAAQTAGWAWFWPRLAFACGALALLGIVVMFALPQGKKKQDGIMLAKLEAAKEAQPMSPLPEESPGKAAAISPAATSFESDENRVAVSAPPGVLSGDVPSPRADPPVRDDKSYARSASRADVSPQPERLAAAKAFSKLSADSEAAMMKSFDASKTGESKTAIAAAPQDSRAMNSAGGWNAKSGAGNVQGKMATVVVAGQISSKDATLPDLQQSLAYQMPSNTGQRFRNTALLENKKKANQLPVLAEFSVAQNGEVLTIVDRDGSIYNGYARRAPESRQNFAVNSGVEPANPVQSVPNTGNGGRAGAALDQHAMNRAFGQTQNAPAIALNNADQSQTAWQSLQNVNTMETANYDFRVEGTNRSLNQRVIFTGNISQISQNGIVSSPDNHLQTGANVSNSQTFRQQQNVPQFNQNFLNNGQQAPAFNNSINGRVVLGNMREVELNALPASQ